MALGEAFLGCRCVLADYLGVLRIVHAGFQSGCVLEGCAGPAGRQRRGGKVSSRVAVSQVAAGLRQGDSGAEGWQFGGSRVAAAAGPAAFSHIQQPMLTCSHEHATSYCRLPVSKKI